MDKDLARLIFGYLSRSLYSLYELLRNYAYFQFLAKIATFEDETVTSREVLDESNRCIFPISSLETSDCIYSCTVRGMDSAQIEHSSKALGGHVATTTFNNRDPVAVPSVLGTDCKFRPRMFSLSR